MAYIKTGRALGSEILDALCIDKTDVLKLTLVCEANSIATLVVETAVRVDSGQIGGVIRRYKLTEAA
jgi:hypothetical protein